MSEFTLEAKNIWKSYKKGDQKIDVLKGVDFKLNKGERVLILGPSGSGKTTFLNIVGLIDYPDQGEIYINSQKIDSLFDERASTIRNEFIGFVFQFYNLLPELTALENCMMPLLIKGVPLKKAEEIAKYYLEKVGLKERMNFLPKDLSGGEEQRVAIARALVSHPQIILADEPTGNLDKENEEKVMDIFIHLQEEKGVSLVVVSHNERLKERFEIVYYLDNGKINKG
ncbi:MAG: ABC transporter ATP-binding protein [candidate division WOR-3 bacterium]